MLFFLINFWKNNYYIKRIDDKIGKLEILDENFQNQEIVSHFKNFFEKEVINCEKIDIGDKLEKLEKEKENSSLHIKNKKIEFSDKV